MIEYIKNPKKRIFMMGSADFHEKLFKTDEVALAKTASDKKDKSDKFERDKERLKNIAQISKSLDNYGKPIAS